MIRGTCLSCGEILNAEAPSVRAHLDAHPIESFPVNYTEDGEPDGYATLEGTFVLSCNCGECEHCRREASA